MRKIISVASIMLLLINFVPMSISATTTMTQPVIWTDPEGDGYAEYTDSLGNTWITLTIDENGNRLILSKDILGVTRFNENFDYDQPSHEGDYDDYEGSTLEAEMEKFYNGGYDANGEFDTTKINETVYYLAPELKALAQPVILPDDEVLTQDDGDDTFNELEDAYVYSYSGGMSYVDEAGETTCFALSTSEVFKYLTPNGEANGDVAVPTRAAVHSKGSNYADTGTPYSTTDDVGEDKIGGSGWYTRSSDQQLATAQIGANKVSSSGSVGSTWVDTYLGFRPALWVSEADTDMDGINDSEEAAIGTDPLNPDTDNDGIYDSSEVVNGTNPLNADTDGDGLNDKDEILESTDPLNPDTDGDGLYDGEEIKTHHTNPLDVDTDKDGLHDGTEVILGLGNPVYFDTDNDGLNDYDEYIEGTNAFNVDTDNDGIYDSFDDNPTTPDVVDPVDPNYGADADNSINNDLPTNGDIPLVDNGDDYLNNDLPTNGDIPLVDNGDDYLNNDLPEVELPVDPNYGLSDGSVNNDLPETPIDEVDNETPIDEVDNEAPIDEVDNETENKEETLAYTGGALALNKVVVAMASLLGILFFKKR